VRAALDLVDREGGEALSMRRVAEGVGAATMSLYWHVANREELVSLMADETLRDMVLPPDGAGWREQVATLAQEYVRALQRHPGLRPLLLELTSPGPKMVGVLDRVVGVLRDAGLSDEDALLAASAVNSVCLSQLVGHVAASDGDGRQVLSALSATQFPHLAAAARAMGPRWSEWQRFEFALELVLDGLARRVEQHS
jgi:AcrR family transcriptional regulator